MKSALTYKQLSDNVFNWAAIIIHVSTVTLAISIEDIAIVFEVCGSIGSNAIMFFLPGVGYLLALRRYGTASMRQKWATKFWHALAWFFVIFSIFLFALTIVIETLKVLGKVPD